MSKSFPRRNEIINLALLIWVFVACGALSIINPLILILLFFALTTRFWTKTACFCLLLSAIVCLFFIGGESIFYPVFFLAVHTVGHSTQGMRSGEIPIKDIEMKHSLSLAVGATILLGSYIILNWSLSTAIMFLILPTLIYWLYILRRSSH